MHPSRLLFLVLIIVSLGGSFLFYANHRKIFPKTEDAYIKADIVTIAARVTGPAIAVYVKENDFVKKGDKLFDLDPSVYRANLALARAEYQLADQLLQANRAAVSTAQANLNEKNVVHERARKSLARLKKLFDEKLVSDSEYEKSYARNAEAAASVSSAESDLKKAESELGESGEFNARRKYADAKLRLAKLEYDFTMIRAPSSGWITNKNLVVGDTVVAGRTQFSIVKNEEWWVEANFKETNMTNMREGQVASILIDMYPQVTLTGKVASLSAGSGSTFSLLPPENATGNWVKVTQRFPVRINITNPHLLAEKNLVLRVGSSAVVTVDTR